MEITVENIKRYMVQPRCIEYPDKIPDDYGCGYRDDKYFTDPKKDKPRIVTLEITSFMGYSVGAVHYYGELRAEGVGVHPIGEPNTFTSATHGINTLYYDDIHKYI
jgi:hypothetical protein